MPASKATILDQLVCSVRYYNGFRSADDLQIFDVAAAGL